MNRDFYIDKLLLWKKSNRRKPLILEGARQVGKTWFMREFARTQYENVVYVRFDKDKLLRRIFDADFDIERIVHELEIARHVKIKPESTVILFDEIQACKNALTALKYFSEDRPDLHVIAAGSLLGLEYRDDDEDTRWREKDDDEDVTTGFPVGKVDTLKVYPLTFEEYEQMKADADAYLKELKKKQNELEDQITNYAEGLEDINKELEEMLRKRAEMQEKTYIAEAELLWPVKRTYRTISSYYGPRTYTYKGKKISDTHIGIDITGGGINKTPIYAVADGEVITAKEHSSYGNYIIIDHGSGITTLYAHCNKLYVKKGDVVKAGDQIAEVGTTGQSTGPHLHFEIRVAGKTVNPLEKSDKNGKHPYVVQPSK